MPGRGVSRRRNAHDGFTAADEHSLILAGFLAFADPPIRTPPRRVAADEARRSAGKDSDRRQRTGARTCARRWAWKSGAVVLGDELDQMSDPALGHVAEEATIFARVSPMQKLRIILALKQRGHVVGYMGDGINDAPSLHAADVGISVSTAVDVARDAADIILLETGPGNSCIAASSKGARLRRTC